MDKKKNNLSLAAALVIWNQYNKAEQKLNKLHKPHMDFQEAIIASLFMLSLNATERAERNESTVSEELIRDQSKLLDVVNKESERLASSQEQIGRTVINQAVQSLDNQMKELIKPIRPIREQTKLTGESINYDLKNYSERLWKNQEKIRDILENDIKKGLQEGKSIQSISRDIQKRTGQSEYAANRLARTETMRFLNQRSISNYIAAGYRYVREMVVEDERTSDQCLAHVGLIHPIEEAPDLPRHPNCRCTFAPYGERLEPGIEQHIEDEAIDIPSFASRGRNHVNSDEVIEKYLKYVDVKDKELLPFVIESMRLMPERDLKFLVDNTIVVQLTNREVKGLYRSELKLLGLPLIKEKIFINPNKADITTFAHEFVHFVTDKQDILNTDYFKDLADQLMIGSKLKTKIFNRKEEVIIESDKFIDYYQGRTYLTIDEFNKNGQKIDYKNLREVLPRGYQSFITDKQGLFSKSELMYNYFKGDWINEK